MLKQIICIKLNSLSHEIIERNHGERQDIRGDSVRRTKLSASTHQEEIRCYLLSSM